MTSPKRGNIFALGLIFFLVISMVAISIAVLFTGVDADKATLAITVVQDLIIFLIPVLIYCLITHTKLTEIIPHEKLSLKNILYIIILTILISPIILVVSSITTLFYSSYDNNAAIFATIDALPMSLCILALAIMPAVFEELAFRGIVLSNYKSISLLKAAFVSGLFFGLFHMDFYQIPYAIAAGIFFSFLVRYTNSIYASMLSHFLINATQVIEAKILFLVGGSSEINRQLELLETSDSYGTITTGVFLTLIATPLLILTIKKFMGYNKNHKLDYELSITQTDINEFEIPIDSINGTKSKFVDIYFVAYVIVAITFTVIMNILK